MLNPNTFKWSKSKQFEVINEIIKKYPTGNDFKNALLTSKNKKLISIAQTIPDDMTRYQYVDYLQYVFIKYNPTGRFLTTLLSGIGLGILANYLGVYFSLQPNFNSENIANKIGNAAIDTFAFNDPLKTIKSDIHNQALKAGTIGGLASVGAGLGGSALTNSIWKWRDDKVQKNIEDLKKTNNKITLNYMYHKGLL